MTDFTALSRAAALVFGLLVGSFSNVCIYRIPAGESVVVGRSHCAACGRTLAWYELFPLLSWLCLGGRCRTCKARISAQYPLIEAANAALWVLSIWYFGSTAVGWLSCLLLTTLLIASVIDARTRELPPQLTLFVAMLGIARLLFDLPNWKSYLLGGLSISCFLLLLFVLSNGAAIGGGDVKLMAGLGLFLGLKLVVFGFFAGCIVGSIVHMIRMRFFGADRALAMGPYLSVGAVLALFLGNPLIRWYFSFLGS